MFIKVKIHRLFNNPESNTKAIASIQINGEYAVHGFKIMENANGGRFIAMPSTKNSNGEYYDIFHPLSKGVRMELSMQIIGAYKECLDKQLKLLDPCEHLPKQLEINENNYISGCKDQVAFSEVLRENDIYSE